MHENYARIFLQSFVTSRFSKSVVYTITLRNFVVPTRSVW